MDVNAFGWGDQKITSLRINLDFRLKAKEAIFSGLPKTPTQNTDFTMK